jgi:hypothetical protein
MLGLVCACAALCATRLPHSWLVRACVSLLHKDFTRLPHMRLMQPFRCLGTAQYVALCVSNTALSVTHQHGARGPRSAGWCMVSVVHAKLWHWALVAVHMTLWRLDAVLCTVMLASG